jgi:plasmid stabilization system protein ParE
VKPVRYDPEARAEFLDAVRWYAQRNVMAAIRFDERVSRAEEAILEGPRQWPRVEGVPRELDVRRRLVDGFPFAVVYVELDTEILILAVAHGKRRPGYWRERIPPSPT